MLPKAGRKKNDLHTSVYNFILKIQIKPTDLQIVLTTKSSDRVWVKSYHEQLEGVKKYLYTKIRFLSPTNWKLMKYISRMCDSTLKQQ